MSQRDSLGSDSEDGPPADETESVEETDNENSEPDHRTHGKTEDAGSEGGAEDGLGDIVDNISESLTDEGFGVYHGREFISIREGGHLAPNATITERYMEGKVAVVLAYNESDNEIAVIPLEEKYDRPNIFALQSGDPPTISARRFLKYHDIIPDQTIRYSPEWDEDLGGDAVEGGLRIDLDEDGEVVNIATDADEPAEE